MGDTMKHISLSTISRDLGVCLLTGEACAFSQRVLCDVNEKGAALVKEWLGLPADTKLTDNWNQWVDDKPSVGSIMLDRGAFPALLRFAALRDGWQYVYGREDGDHYTLFNDSDIQGPYQDLARIVAGEAMSLIYPEGRLWRNPRPRGDVVGTRNVHAFSGRSV